MQLGYKKHSSAGVRLWILRNFSEHIFYRTPPGDCLFHVQVAGFQPAFIIKNSFTSTFQVFCAKARGSHWKPLNQFNQNPLKISVKKFFRSDVARCQPDSLLNKIAKMLFQVFYLHFLRINYDYFFRRGF